MAALAERPRQVAFAEMPQQAALAGGPQVAGHSEQRLFEPGGVTLEDSILAIWEDLTSTGRAECPVCGGWMRAGSGCEGCGSELS